MVMNASGSQAWYVVALVQLIYLFAFLVFFVIPLNPAEKSTSAFMTFSPAKRLNSMSLRMKKLSFRPLRLTDHLLADWLKQQ